MTSPAHKQDDDKEPDWLNHGKRIGKYVVLAFFGLAIIQFLLVASTQWIFDKDDIAAFGISGDFFGAINALFSSLAFAALLVTLWMQKYELSQQREELGITREVMIQQQKEMEEQRKSLQRQTFENTFFNMLKLHGEIVETVTLANGKRVGRLIFSMMDDDMRSDLMIGDNEHAHVYLAVYNRYESIVSHYFRTLYNIVRYIDENGGEQRSTYARLVRAQLSKSELVVLTYNCLSNYGIEKFKPLVEKYALLKHLPKDHVAEEAIRKYSPLAFGAYK